MTNEAASRTSALKRSSKVSADETAPQKRSRVSRACDQCRASREKCDGIQPTCQTCESQKRDCSYNEQPKKRGIPPNYIRTLELTLAWMFRQSPDLEARLSEELPIDGHPAQQLISGKDGSDDLHQAWRSSIICRQIDQMLSGLPLDQPSAQHIDNDLIQSPPRSAHSDLAVADDHVPHGEGSRTGNDQVVEIPAITGSTSGQPPVQMQQDTFPPLNSDQPIFAGIVPMLEDEHILDVDSGYRLRLPINAWPMLEHYFAFTHSWLPITDRQSMLKLMYTFPKDGISLGDAGAYAELWSVFALIAAQAPPTGQIAGHSEDYEIVAKRLIPEKVEECSIEHIRAILLLGIIQILRESWATAWLIVGSAVRRLLLVDTNSATYPEAQNMARSRTMLAAFVLETALSTRLRVPAHLIGEHLLVKAVIEDGLEEWSPWQDTLATDSIASRKPIRSLTTFNRIVRAALHDHSDAENDNDRDASSFCLQLLQALLRNAGLGLGRSQPALLVDDMEISRAAANRRSNTHPSRHHDSYVWTGLRPAHARDLASKGQTGSHAFMSIPIDNAEALTRQSSNPQYETDSASDMRRFLETQPSNPDSFGADMTLPDHDIFEELAMLDDTESSRDQHFMQNLGFAPDQDLAEFFGADYQPSDPLLATLFSPNAGSEVG